VEITDLCPAVNTRKLLTAGLSGRLGSPEQRPVMSLSRSSVLGALCALLVFASHVAAGLFIYKYCITFSIAVVRAFAEQDIMSSSN
jgi:hypothetical protein